MRVEAESDRWERYERVRSVIADESIEPVYQPIMELGGGQVIAYEALSRFPGNGAYTADRWFADAWEFGLGMELELLAVRLTSEALDALPPDLPLCINASPAAIAAESFLPSVNGSLDRIVVEVTEHFGLEEAGDLRLGLGPLRSKGGRTAIDDFGAGFA